MYTQLTDKTHQIYFTQRQYEKIARQCEYSFNRTFSDQIYLIAAKSFFIKQSYDRTISYIQKINSRSSPKVLYQRQCLLFKAKYLQNRKKIPNTQIFQELKQIIKQFKTLKDIFPQKSFKESHLNRIKIYQNFIDDLIIYVNSQIRISKDYNQEKKIFQKSHKYDGFPCYIISQQWYSDWEDIRNGYGQYLTPFNNLAIINEIYECHFYEQSQQQNKNCILFPTTKIKTVNKKYWKYHTMYSNGKQYLPIKRIYNSKLTSKNIKYYEFIPILIYFNNIPTVYQLTPNNTFQNQILYLLQEQHGLGILKSKQKNSTKFDQLYDQQKLQNIYLQINQSLQYQLKNLPESFNNKKYRYLLNYDLNPLNPNIFQQKKGGLKGLQNCGNSCYFSSCMQVLSFTKQISIYLATNESLNIINFQNNKGGKILLPVSNIIKQLWKQNNKKQYIQPHKYKTQIGKLLTQFAQTTQEDAHQFLLHILNQMHQQIKKTGSSSLKRTSKLQQTNQYEKVKSYFQRHQIQQNNSIITQNLRGVIHGTIVCQNCNQTNHSFDTFLALSLPIPQKVIPSINFYFIAYKTREIQKFQFFLQNMKNIKQIIDFFFEQISKNVITSSKIQQKKQSDPKNYDYIFVLYDQKTNTIQKQIYRIKQNIKQQQNNISTQQLLQLSKTYSFIFYQINKVIQNQVIVKFQYYLDDKIIYMPKLFLLNQQQILGNKNQKQIYNVIHQNDKQNIFQFKQIYQIRLRQNKDTHFSHKYIVQTQFRSRRSIILQQFFIQRQFNRAFKPIPLQNCYQLFKKKQDLDQWKCTKCKKVKTCKKMQIVCSTGDLLIITLKRFQYDGVKIKNLVQYPLQGLDLSKWIQNNNDFTAIYDLYAVILHEGTMNAGHYKALCKHFVSGEWYEFDDKKVTLMKQSSIVNQFAYLLFYRKKKITK